MRVDLPSSTLPHVLKRRISTGTFTGLGGGRISSVNILEIAGFLAVFHRGLGGFVVGAGAALGDAGGGAFRDDVRHGGGGRLDAPGANDVTDGADADHELADLLLRLGRDEIVDREPLAAAADALAAVAEINGGHFQLLALD